MASHSSVPVDPKGFEAYLLSDLTNHLSLLEVKALHDAAITASIKLKAEHDGVNERLDGLDTLLKKVTAATRRRNKRESQKEYSEAFRKWRSSYIRLVRRCGDGTDAVQCATNALHDMLELIDPDKGQGGQEVGVLDQVARGPQTHASLAVHSILDDQSVPGSHIDGRNQGKIRAGPEDPRRDLEGELDAVRRPSSQLIRRFRIPRELNIAFPASYSFASTPSVFPKHTGRP